MATKIIQDGTLTDIADAIRAKTGKSATMTPLEMPSEIASIETGGGGIETGLEVVDYYDNGRIKEVNWYGDVPPYSFFYHWYNSNPVTVHIIDATSFSDCCFQNANVNFDMSSLEKITYIGSYALTITAGRANDCREKALLLPNLSGEHSAYVGKSSRFRVGGNIYYYGEIYLPKLQTIEDYDFYQAKVSNQTIQIGSVGYPVTYCGQRPWGGSTGSGTITIYTTGALLDTIKTNAQAQSGANYTFIYKASEATTYNGTSYNADDTMMTSTGA